MFGLFVFIYTTHRPINSFFITLNDDKFQSLKDLKIKNVEVNFQFRNFKN